MHLYRIFGYVQCRYEKVLRAMAPARSSLCLWSAAHRARSIEEKTREFNSGFFGYHQCREMDRGDYDVRQPVYAFFGDGKETQEEVEDKQNKEIAKGGVLCCDSKTPSTILSHGVGYIADDCVLDSDRRAANDENARTDYEVERRYENGQKALKKTNHGSFTKKVFEQNVRTHNECVFDLYTPEMRLVRAARSRAPDSYGRGRLIGDYRRVIVGWIG